MLKWPTTGDVLLISDVGYSYGYKCLVGWGYIFISEHVLNDINKSSIQTWLHSDHNIVTLELNNDKLNRGNLFWKINNNLLHYTETVKWSNLKTMWVGLFTWFMILSDFRIFLKLCASHVIISKWIVSLSWTCLLINSATSFI